jgi:hypothetical protein
VNEARLPARRTDLPMKEAPAKAPYPGDVRRRELEKCVSPIRVFTRTTLCAFF